MSSSPRLRIISTKIKQDPENEAAKRIRGAAVLILDRSLNGMVEVAVPGYDFPVVVMEEDLDV